MTINYLEKIKSADIDELKSLSDQIRKRIIHVVSQTGGHLAPSLGVVDLTVALHHVFDSPKDSFVWDVGHQAYSHKIITGRDNQMETIRQYQGLSGFTKRAESPHDPFGVGHSSTSISAALGIAEGKKLSGDKGKTIAIIGDGSMTAGLAFEGLNHAGHVLNKRLLVILNDNQMSIDHNVGALAKFMNKGLTSPTYNRIRRDLKTLFKVISRKDLNIIEMSRRAALVVKDFFLAGSLFEAFGFRYIGPIDGHDLDSLIPTLQHIDQIIEDDEEIARPVLLHVLTQKGKGYDPAEKDPSTYHGVAAVQMDEGEFKKTDQIQKTLTYTKAFGNTVETLMEKDSRVIAITAAMPAGTGLTTIKEKFPGRYYDVGIAEPHAVVFAAGLAVRGFRPIVAVYSSFLQRGYDEIIHDVCLQNLPVIFAMDRAGVVGEDGPTHHGVFDISYLRHIPGLIVMAPKDENELQNMLHSALTYDAPVAIRYPRGAGVGVDMDSEFNVIPKGQADVLQYADDAKVSIIAVGKMVSHAVEAAAILQKNNITANVINARFIKPLPSDMILDEAKKSPLIVTVEDNILEGGFGSAVLELLNESDIAMMPKVLRLGYPDEYIPQGKISILHEKYGLDAAGIAQLIINKCRKHG